MAIPQPGLATTVPGISEPLVPAGVVSVDATLTGSGAAGSPLSVVQNYLKFLGSFVASALPSAAAHQGAFALVTDGTNVVWGTTVTGSGSAIVLAWSDGANWTVAAI